MNKLTYHITIPVSGLDNGQSGLSTFLFSVLDDLYNKKYANTFTVLLVGTNKEVKPFLDRNPLAHTLILPRVFNNSIIGSLVNHYLISLIAKVLKTDLLFLPAINRRSIGYKKLPTIGVVHDLLQIHIKNKYSKLRMFYFKWFILRNLRNFDKLIAVSDTTKIDIVNYDQSLKSYTIVLRNKLPLPSKIDEHNYKPNNPAIKDLLGESYLLYPSRMEIPNKNHMNLLSAFKEISSDTKLIFTGAESNGTKNVKDRIENDINLSGKVYCLGFIKQTDLDLLYKHCKGVLSVALAEGFGYLVLEAEKYNKPILLSNCKAHLEFSYKQSIYCDPRSISSIKNGLTNLVTNSFEDSTITAMEKNKKPTYYADLFLDYCRKERVL